MTEGTPNEVTVTITDNDTVPGVGVQTVTVSAPALIMESEGATVDFTVTLSADPAADTMIPIIVGSGTAVLGIDYTLSATSVIFTAGTGSDPVTQTVTVTALDDSMAELDETIILSVDASSIDGVVNGATTLDTITIEDTDPPELSLSWASTRLTEGDSAILTVTSAQPIRTALRVYLNFDDGNTATARTFSNRTGHVSFSNGPGYSSDDMRFDPVTLPSGAGSMLRLRLDSHTASLTQDETLVLTLILDPTDNTTYTISNTAGSATLTLVDDTTAPANTVSNVMVTDASTTEGSTRTLQFNVSWTEPMLPDDYAATVIGWRAQGSSDPYTADNAAEYDSLCREGACAPLPLTLPFSDHSALTAGTYEVQVWIQDTNGNRSTVVTETITLVDLPAVPTALSATASSDSQIDLTWTAPSGTVTGYLVEVSPDGNTNTFNPVATPHTGTSATYSHTGLTASTPYHYRVSAINSAGTGMPSDVAMATTQAAAANPTVSLSVSPATISEADVGTTATLTVTLSSEPTSEVTILVMVDDTSTATRGTGNDYTLSSTSLIFGTSDTTKTVTIVALNDVVDDNDETIVLSVDADTIDGVDAGTPTSVMVTITDDDDAPAVSFSSTAVTVEEDVTGGSVEVTLELTHPSASALVIPVSTTGVTATAGSDYTELTDMNVTIAAGMTTQTVSITILLMTI